MCLQKVKSQYTEEKKLVTVFVGILKANEEKNRIRNNGSFRGINIT
jgi:hypothetical protein